MVWKRWLLIACAVMLCSVFCVAISWTSSGAADLAKVRQARLEGIRSELTQKGLRLGEPVLIRIFKQSGELEVWVKSAQTYRLYKTFRICAWSGELGPKLREGDGQSPEGFYTVSRARMKPDSQYHLAFNLGYPNAFDRANNRTGSFLMVHGNCVSIGCYAMTDRGIEEIWLIADEALRGGQSAFQVHVFPFRMTEDNLKAHEASQWSGFWRDLKPGYDLFERRKSDLRISVVNRRYVISE